MSTQVMSYDKQFERWEKYADPVRLSQIYEKMGWGDWRAMFKRDILELVGAFDEPRILDVGCFSGNYLRLLLHERLCFDYTGIDVTPSYVRFARERFSDNSGVANAQRQKFRFSEGNAFGIEYADDSFDIAIFTGVLHHLPEVDRPLDEVFRIASKRVLLGLYIHADEGVDEKMQTKDGFLYKTWSKHYIFDQVDRRGNIEKTTFHPSPHYDYQHCSLVIRPNP